MNIIGDKNLPKLKRAACLAIDLAAETCRQRHATPGHMQATVYVQKAAEARDFLTAYPVAGLTIITPDEDRWPFLSAEVNITAATMRGVALAIDAAASAWADKARKIESLRLRSKAGVMLASTPAMVLAAQEIIWP